MGVEIFIIHMPTNQPCAFVTRGRGYVRLYLDLRLNRDERVAAAFALLEPYEMGVLDGAVFINGKS